MSVVLDRPYRFVPPDLGNIWPTMIQWLRIYDRHLRKKEGVVDFEVRGLDHWRSSLDRGDGILLAPNHCRYADPLVLGWPAREVGVHVSAMASWHLFNRGGFESFAIRKMGAFSVYREGPDRQALEAAIDMLQHARRPLILFPEGSTNRTNDVLKPLLDGVAFIARTAARKRAKAGDGNLVIHPVGIKYLCLDPVRPWAERQLDAFERHLGWAPRSDVPILDRVVGLTEALLSLQEIRYLGSPRTGMPSQRREHLMTYLLESAEAELKLDPASNDPRARLRAVRTEASARFFAAASDEAVRQSMRREIAKTDLVVELVSYPDGYLDPATTTDTRVVETIQRMQEAMFGTADCSMRLKSIIQFDEAIGVPPEKGPRGERDPLLIRIEQRLGEMLGELSNLARPMSAC